MFICPSCQTENRATAKFCRKCGLPRSAGEKDPGEPPPVPAEAPPPAPQPDQPSEPRRAGPTCPSCGANVRGTDKFCIWCGERQPQRARPKTKRCPECRTHLPMSANFCYVCGNEVGQHGHRRVGVPTELFGEEDPELFPKFEA